MKSPRVVFCLLIGVTLVGCGSLSTIFAPTVYCPHDAYIDHSPLSFFLFRAEQAAEQLPSAESSSDWQESYEAVKTASRKLPDVPDEDLSEPQRKECDHILEQMEIGRLGLQLKRVDARAGAKQCKVVAAAINKHVKKVRTSADYEAQILRHLNTSGKGY
jgi:hypothetical protein